MRRKWQACILSGAVMTALAGGYTNAASITGLTSDSELGGHDALGDGGSTFTGTITSNTNNMDFRIGSGGTSTSPGNFNAVMVFDLPSLSAGETFDTASLQINLSAKNGTLTGINADLYAIGARTTSTVAAPGDYYLGVFGADPTSATPLHDDLLVPATPLGTVATSGGIGTGASTLTSYLNSLYASDPAAGDKFLFLRLNPDTDPSGTNNRYRVTPANDVNSAIHPTLIYTTVPEPGTTGMLAAVGVLGALRRRRRHSR